jgi:hypothetical protein
MASKALCTAREKASVHRFSTFPGAAFIAKMKTPVDGTRPSDTSSGVLPASMISAPASCMPNWSN